MKVSDVVTFKYKRPEQGNQYRITKLELWGPGDDMVTAYDMRHPEIEIKVPESELILWSDYI